jgi:lauroyl/myristoyl acyltransferase
MRQVQDQHQVEVGEMQSSPKASGFVKHRFLQLLCAHPATFLALAGWKSHLRSKCAAYTPRTDELAAVWARLTAAVKRGMAHRIGAIEYLNRELFSRVERIDQVTPLVRCRNTEMIRSLHARKEPAILVSWHFRTLCYSVVSALQRLEIPALILGYLPLKPSNEYQLISPSTQDPTQRALVLKKTLDHLKAGGIVYTCIDAAIGFRTTPVSFLGQKFNIRRGSAVLSRLSGAPLIPVTPRWNWLGSSITVTFHDPLPPPAASPADGPAFENALLGDAIRWIEQYFHKFPEELCMERLAKSLDGCETPACAGDAPITELTPAMPQPDDAANNLFTCAE